MSRVLTARQCFRHTKQMEETYVFKKETYSNKIIASHPTGQYELHNTNITMFTESVL